MNNEEFQDLLSDHFDGTLTGERLEVFCRALESDPDLEKEVRVQQEITSLLGRIEPPKAPENLHTRIMEQLLEEQANALPAVLPIRQGFFSRFAGLIPRWEFQAAVAGAFVAGMAIAAFFLIPILSNSRFRQPLPESVAVALQAAPSSTTQATPAPSKEAQIADAIKPEIAKTNEIAPTVTPKAEPTEKVPTPQLIANAITSNLKKLPPSPSPTQISPPSAVGIARIPFAGIKRSIKSAISPAKQPSVAATPTTKPSSTIEAPPAAEPSVANAPLIAEGPAPESSIAVPVTATPAEEPQIQQAKEKEAIERAIEQNNLEAIQQNNLDMAEQAERNSATQYPGARSIAMATPALPSGASNFPTFAPVPGQTPPPTGKVAPASRLPFPNPKKPTIAESKVVQASPPLLLNRQEMSPGIGVMPSAKPEIIAASQTPKPQLRAPGAPAVSSKEPAVVINILLRGAASKATGKMPGAVTQSTGPAAASMNQIESILKKGGVQTSRLIVHLESGKLINGLTCTAPGKDLRWVLKQLSETGIDYAPELNSNSLFAPISIANTRHKLQMDGAKNGLAFFSRPGSPESQPVPASGPLTFRIQFDQLSD